jgi:hypothetical protein
VTVPAGRTAATFTIETNGVSGEETATIDAVLGTSHKTAALTITPATLSGLSLSPTSVVGGNSCTGTVTLSGPAPPQGAFVALQSSLGQATLPANVTIPGGATTATFTVKTIGVSASTTTTISGILGGKTLTANLVIQPATIQSFTLAPSTVAGGNPTIGTVTLNGNAPFGGAVIKLASNVKTAILPASVTIAAGSTNGTVSIGTTVVTKPSTATLTATLGASSQTAALLIEPTALQSVSVAPSTVIGGSNTPVVGAVTLTGPASASGMTVTLSSSNSKAASVPASVRVAAGKTSATFAVSHALTASIQTSVIKATAGAATETATLTISPMMISSLNLNPSTVAGGFNSSGVITLNATLASHGGPVTIKLTANSGLIKIPPAVSVPAGANSSKFTIATTPVALTQSAGITSTLGAGSQTASLTIEPPTLASLVLKPTSVKGSSSTPVTGMVTLTSPAPAGGIEILLSSSSTAASTPATIIVSAGKLSAVFTVKHGKVSILTAVTISAKLNGTIKTTVLAVTP